MTKAEIAKGMIDKLPRNEENYLITWLTDQEPYLRDAKIDLKPRLLMEFDLVGYFPDGSSIAIINANQVKFPCTAIVT